MTSSLMRPPLMRVENLVKSFGAVRALDGVSFALNAGEVHGFIGPNGAGKTTAMRIMAGVERPDAGEIFPAGGVAAGFMPDYLDAYPGILVREYLDFHIRLYPGEPARRRERVREVAGFTGIGELLKRPVETLSKGWLQRLSLARALLPDPDVLILDEPAAGLDPRARIELRDMMAELARRGKAIFLSSHILSELGEMCAAATIIEEGRIRSSGPVDALREQAGGGAGAEVELLGPDAGELRRLADFLARSPGASGIGDVRATASGAIFRCPAGAAGRAETLARLIAAGFRVTDFRRAASSLEDAFMAVTKTPAKKEGE